MVFVILTLTLAGCCCIVVPKPSSISLESAMQSVGTGLAQMRKAEGDLRTGLIPDEVEVNMQGMKRKRLELANLKTLRSPFAITLQIAEIGDKLVLKIIT
jgi:hypothetical protein